MKIILVSDTHLSARAPAFNANWEAGKRWIVSQKADAIVHLGDITADAIVYPEELAFAAQSFGDMSIHLVPGNHDVGDQPIAGKMEYQFDPVRLAQYQDVFGPSSWWFRKKRWLFIGLNAQLLGSDSHLEEQQFAWLSRLVECGDERLALFLHKPLFRDNWSEKEVGSRYISPAARDRLKAILPRERLALVASGHVHQARRMEKDDTLHVWVPSTSFCIPDVVQEPIGEKIVGLAVLELDRSGASVTFVEPEGMIRHNLMKQETVYPQLRDFDPALRNAIL